MKELAPGIVVYDNVIPNSENLYNTIEKRIVLEKLEWSSAKVKEGEDDHINKNSRDTSIFGVKYFGKTITANTEKDLGIYLNNLFFENFDPIEKDYLSSFGIFSNWHDTYGILKYGKGQKFTNHIDDHPDYHRRVSTVYYLNDEYTGGEINFPRFNITFKPSANQMIVFPSTYVYNHSVSEVINGTRYAVVSWLR